MGLAGRSVGQRGGLGRQPAHEESRGKGRDGQGAERKGDREAAMQDYKQATDLDPKLASAFFAMGNLDMLTKNNAAALNDFSKVIEITPDSAFAYVRRGQTYMAMNDSENARKDFEQALKLDADGQYAPLVKGFRTTELETGTRFIRRIHLEAIDGLGRELVADGELVSRHGTKGPSGTGLFHFTWTDGRDGWGEDQSYGPAEWFEALDGLN